MTFFGVEISITENLVTFTRDNVGMGPNHFVKKLNVYQNWTLFLLGPIYKLFTINFALRCI